MKKQIQNLVNRCPHGERGLIAFIHGRHCSHVDKAGTLDDAIDTASSYGVWIEEIETDFTTVEGYADLDQYCRGYCEERQEEYEEE